MEFVAAAMVCIFLYICKGGLPGPVCFMLFIGYCVFRISQEREKNIKRRELFEREKHGNEIACAKAKAERDELERQGKPFNYYPELAIDFCNKTKIRIARSRELRQDLASGKQRTKDGKNILDEIEELDYKLRESAANVPEAISYMENSFRYAYGYSHYVNGKNTMIQTSILKDLCESVMNNEFAEYMDEMEEWRKANGR